MSSTTTTGAVPVTCCGRDGGCICAQEAKCSCGKQPALQCTCEKSSTENKTSGARCSCSKSKTIHPSHPPFTQKDTSQQDHKMLTQHPDQRPAGECNCSRASNENDKPSGSACACGKRSANACNCEGTEVGGNNASELETDFTTKA
jgi:hypothetical protein